MVNNGIFYGALASGNVANPLGNSTFLEFSLGKCGRNGAFFDKTRMGQKKKITMENHGILM